MVCPQLFKKKYAKRKENINISMHKMSNICKQYVPKGKEVDFCKIDVEGNEREVLLGYDFTNYKPKVFCIESTVPLSPITTYQLWEEILINNGFTFVYSRGVNRYYVNNKYPDILERSKNIITINNFVNKRILLTLFFFGFLFIFKEYSFGFLIYIFLNILFYYFYY